MDCSLSVKYLDKFAFPIHLVFGLWIGAPGGNQHRDIEYGKHARRKDPIGNQTQNLHADWLKLMLY